IGQRGIGAALLASALLIGAGGCFDPMREQPRYDPLEESDFFPDRMASRPLVPGTIARGQLILDNHLLTGQVNGQPATEFPKAIAEQDPREVLKRGQELYNIFCAPCHDRIGNGHGMVPRRGFPHPPSFHTDRLRQAPVGHLFDVPTNGFGRMPSYRDRTSPEDRWAIVAYIRALQFSQSIPPSELDAGDLEKLWQ